jgi:hypothetical protein
LHELVNCFAVGSFKEEILCPQKADYGSTAPRALQLALLGKGFTARSAGGGATALCEKWKITHTFRNKLYISQ